MIIEVHYKPAFVRRYSSLERDLQEEIAEKIELFKDPANHKQLKVHKLHDHLKRCNSFSVNYKIRIVFQYLSRKDAVLLTVGDHEIYE